MDKLRSSGRQKGPLLKDVFIDEAVKLGYKAADGQVLLKELPICFHDLEMYIWGGIGNAPQEWVYMYGDLFELDRGPAFGSPYNSPRLTNLIHAYFIAKRNLSAKQFDIWSANTTNKGKHLDPIVEMTIVVNVDPAIRLRYEDPKIGKSPIDWLLQTNTEEILIEVKNRPGLMAQVLNSISRTGQTKILDEPIDMRKLFKSTVNKFDLISNSKYIQGVALCVGALVPKKLIEDYFFEALQGTFHFVVLVRLEGTHVNIITSSDTVKKKILSVFGWIDNGALLSDESKPDIV